MRHTFDDIDEHHIAKFLFSQPLGCSGPYVTSADNRYFFVHNMLLLGEGLVRKPARNNYTLLPTVVSVHGIAFTGTYSRVATVEAAW
ncbi:hypothetical protein JCM12296A_13440 [Desulfosarcina cetonica]